MRVVKCILSLIAIANAVTTSQQTLQGQKVQQSANQKYPQSKNEEEDEASFMSYDPTKSLISVMADYPGDFGPDLFQELLTRKEISHLFLSDIGKLENQLLKEFPDVVSLDTIGETWEKRQITLITLDARKLVNSEKFKSIPYAQHASPAPAPAANTTAKAVAANVTAEAKSAAQNSSTAANATQNATSAAETEDTQEGNNEEKVQESEEKNESQEEIFYKNKEIQTKEQNKKDELNQHFEKVSAEAKEKAFSDALGLDLVQTKEEKTNDELGVNLAQVSSSKRKQRRHKKSQIQELHSLLQLSDEEESNVSITETEQEANKPAQAPAPAEKAASVPETKDSAVLVTGATHARELLSSQVPLYLCLKLIHQGVLNKRERYVNMLRDMKFYFIPVINQDGAALVEEHFLSDGKILNKRKNGNPENVGTCGEENSGVDLNRNFGIDWSAARVKNHTELCGDYWPGDTPFSEPESRALRDFVARNKKSIKFVINCHTSGNEFIWPYNGRNPNDIEKRSPGYLAIFQDISKNAPFPDQTMKGNSYEVIGDVMGGDCDDFIMSSYGIPSVTSEMGFFGQYYKDWQCQSKGTCFEILRDNSRWMEYVFTKIPEIAEKLVIK